MFTDVHTTMLKASQNKNVLSCHLKAARDDVLRIDSGRPFHAPDWCKINLAQQTWYAAMGEHSRLFQLTVDVQALTPSWWIEWRQRCTMGNGYCGRHTLNWCMFVSFSHNAQHHTIEYQLVWLGLRWGMFTCIRCVIPYGKWHPVALRWLVQQGYIIWPLT